MFDCWQINTVFMTMTALNIDSKTSLLLANKNVVAIEILRSILLKEFLCFEELKVEHN